MKVKIDFWKCTRCDFQTTLNSEMELHRSPFIDNGKLKAGHQLVNQKNG